MDSAQKNSIYEKMFLAVSGDLPWSLVLADLCTAMQSDMALMICWDAENFIPEWAISYNLPDGVAIIYQNYYSALDPLLRIGLASPELKWLASNNVVSNGFVERSEYFQDFLIPNGVLYVAGCCLYKSGSTCVSLTFERGKLRGPFDNNDFVRLGAIIGHLSLAVKTYCRTLKSKIGSDVFNSHLDMKKCVFYVVDKSRKIKHISFGEGMDPTFDGSVKIQNGVLFLSMIKLDFSLGESINVAISCGIDSGFYLNFNGKELKFSVSAFRSGMAQNCALVCAEVVCGNKNKTPEKINIFFEEYNLSPAERRVAMAIISGQSVNDYCMQNSLSVATVRTQIRSIFRKVGCNRQLDLIRMANQ